MVAVMAVCMVWIPDCGSVHLLDRTHWRHVPYQLSRGKQGLVRHMGFSVACLQQGCNGLHMVRSTGLDRWYVLGEESSQPRGGSYLCSSKGNASRS